MNDTPSCSLDDLPLPLLQAVVERCVVRERCSSPSGGDGGNDGGLATLLTVSRVCRALRRACDDALAAIDSVSYAETAALRHAAPPPDPQAVLRRCAAMSRLLRPMASVVRLDLSHCYAWVDDACLRQIGQTCAQLAELRLDHCERISGDEGLEPMAAAGNLSRLRALSICHCGDVGAGGFLAGLPALKRLAAAYCHSLTERELLAVAPRLESIDLTGCDGVVGDALCARLDSAVDADLSFLSLSDDGLRALAGRARKLRRLTLARRSNNLWGTGRYRDEALAALRRARPDLSVAFKM